jgi:predicted secreted protein with PEFG-CTERM motif
LKKILTLSLVFLALSIIPPSFAWDGLMAMDADKRNVERGQIITYEGFLYGDEPINGEIVSITVFEKETKEIILKADTIPERISVEYFENTAWPFTFQVGTSYKGFVEDTTYVVEASYDDKSTKLDFFIQPKPEPTCLEILGENPILVLTDKEKYDQGDVIKVSGCLSEEAFTKGLNVVVYDPKGNIIGASTFVPNPDRTFFEEFIIDEKFGLNGTYTVEVDAGGIYSSTKSFVVPEFGSIVMIILGISLSAILIKTRFMKSFGNFQ